MMKKLAIALVGVGLFMILTACGTPFNCDICGEEKNGQSHRQSVLGEEFVICHDCYIELAELVSDWE